MKIRLLLAALGLTLGLAAQNLATHIPQQAVMVVKINPGPVITDPAQQAEVRMQLFASGQPFRQTQRYVFGDEDLMGAQQDSLLAFIRLVAVAPQPAGIDPAAAMYAFQDTRDTLSCWGYVFALTNAGAFENYTRTHLFPKANNLQPEKRNGYTLLQNGRITVAYTDSYAWLILADFDYETELRSLRNYNDFEAYEEAAVAVEEYEPEVDAATYRARAIADSTAAAERAKMALAIMTQRARRDSVEMVRRANREEWLHGDNHKHYDSLTTVVVNDREKRRKKGQPIPASLEEEVMQWYYDKIALRVEGPGYLVDSGSSEVGIDEEPPHDIEIFTKPEVDEQEGMVEPPQLVEMEPPQVTKTETYVSEADDYESRWEMRAERTNGLVNRNIRAYLDELIRLDPQQSIAAEPHFSTIANEAYDAVYWYNYSRHIEQQWRQNLRYSYRYNRHRNDIYNNQPVNIDSLMQTSLWWGAGVTGGVRFQGTKLEMMNRMHFNPEAAALAKGMFRGRVSNKLLKYVKTNPYSVMAVSANPEKMMRFSGRNYREQLSLMYGSMGSGYLSLYTHLFSLYRVFLDEDVLYNLLDGDLVMAVTNIVPHTYTYKTYDYDENFQYKQVERQRTELMPEFVMAAGVGRPKKLRELIDIAVKAHLLVKVRDYYIIPYAMEFNTPIYIALRKNRLIITNDSLLVNDYLKKGYTGNKRLTHSERKLLRRSPFAGWWDTERSRLALKQRGEESERSVGRRERMTQVTNKLSFRGRRGPGGLNQIEITAELTPDGLPEYGYIRTLRMLRLLYNLDRSIL